MDERSNCKETTLNGNIDESSNCKETTLNDNMGEISGTWYWKVISEKGEVSTPSDEIMMILTEFLEGVDRLI